MNYDNFIAICAAVVAIISAIDAHRQNNKINKINLHSKYFDKIYNKHLIYNIPKARKYIQFIDNKLTGTDKLVDELNSIRKDSLYFLYNNKPFYDKLKDKLQELENFLMEREGKKFYGEDQTEILNDIQKKLQGIYECINNSYIGDDD